MSRNKFLLPFDLGGPGQIHSAAWVTDRLDIEEIMSNWCIERAGVEGFPNWQFSTRYIHASSFIFSGVDEILMADGIFIFDEETRTAFKLTFEL